MVAAHDIVAVAVAVVGAVDVVVAVADVGEFVVFVGVGVAADGVEYMDQYFAHYDNPQPF